MSIKYNQNSNVNQNSIVNNSRIFSHDKFESKLTVGICLFTQISTVAITPPRYGSHGDRLVAMADITMEYGR